MAAIGEQTILNLRDLPDRRRFLFGENSMRCWFILVFVLCFYGSARPQEAKSGPERLLDLASKARGKEAHHLLNQVIEALAEEKKSKPQDALIRLAREIERSAQGQKEIQAIFGEKAPKTVARQIFFRRYRELWVFEQPAPLTVVFDCIKGKEPKVLSVYPSGEN